MGGLLPDIDTLKDAAKDLAGAFGVKIGGGIDPIYQEDALEGAFPNGDVTTDGFSVPWSIDGTDWYKVFAYQFAVVAFVEEPTSEFASQVAEAAGQLAGGQAAFAAAVGSTQDQGSVQDAFDQAFAAAADETISEFVDREFLYTLPIPPQAMTTKMIPASQATATIGGVVEETGANVFWMITMSGTTGIGVTRGDDGRGKVAKKFRDKIATTGLLSGPLAGVNSVLSKVGGVADQFMDAGNAALNGDIGGATGGLVGALNTALLPALPYAGSGVDRDTNGFTEMQELHRFLYTYSKLKAASPQTYALRFRNYKTNQQWQCILQDFQIQQSAQNPMLQRYTITLKCWDVKPIGADDRASAEFDRFGAGGDLKPVSTISLDDMLKFKDALFNKKNSVDILLGT